MYSGLFPTSIFSTNIFQRLKSLKMKTKIRKESEVSKTIKATLFFLVTVIFLTVTLN